ncbi:starvation responsive small protein [Tieghemostelium lacteum]|uniref:Starvation responsive small protein n=1 Tax=Tieghemostelium lacteum TaxID=361077 RepID=A0A151ZKU5_TIELA|nr:starvation responsive small protein [Tieghemostelium lacteum]|eukprot:KYQ94404.1 starvation responsive small protein [Tieghemostelium lacteum]
MLSRLIKNITPESYILLFNTTVVGAYGVRVLASEISNEHGKDANAPKHTGVGSYFKKRGSQLANGEERLYNIK